MFFLKKTYTLAGFKHVFSVPEADAMSTAPRRQGLKMIFLWAKHIIDSN
jgi:hypothetical protein